MNMLETYNLNSTNYYAHLTEASYDLAAAAAAAAAKPDVNVVHPSPDSHQVLTGAHTVGNTSPSLIPKLEFEKGKLNIMARSMGNNVTKLN